MLKRLILSVLEVWRTKQSRRIPYFELEAKHIQRLRTVVNRDALLDLLPKGGIVAEAGVFKGDFSQLILEKTAPKQLHLIDLWEGKEGRENLELVRKKFAVEIEQGQVVLHQGESVAVLRQLPENTFDWIYIDTDHSYATTAEELNLSAKTLKANGLLLGHDYVTGNWNGGIRYGVVEAVHEFCVKNDWELVYLTAETHRHLSFGISGMR